MSRDACRDEYIHVWNTRDGDPPLVKLAAMLQALEMEPAAVNLSAQQLAVICRGVTKLAKRASTPPAQPSGSEGSVPEGFVLVPKEPTIEMEDAMNRVYPRHNRRQYLAALAAAPQPTTKKG